MFDADLEDEDELDDEGDGHEEIAELEKLERVLHKHGLDLDLGQADDPNSQDEDGLDFENAAAGPRDAIAELEATMFADDDFDE